MTRKINDYLDELSNSLANYGGMVLECSHCGHAVAVINYDIKTFCEYDIICGDCKKDKPLTGINPFEWQKWNNPPLVNPATDKTPWWNNPGTMTWSSQNDPNALMVMNSDDIN